MLIRAGTSTTPATSPTWSRPGRATFEHLGLWDGKDLDQWGSVVAETSCTFFEPIFFGQVIKVGVRTTRLGGQEHGDDLQPA